MSGAAAFLSGAATGYSRQKAQADAEAARARSIEMDNYQRGAGSYHPRTEGIFAQTGGDSRIPLQKYEPTDEFTSLLLEAADELQMDPVTLATMISYETAGTFNPTQKGPTTQWGQHEGLIQFGEPQAKEYGYDRNNALRSQLGRNGAVVKYFRQNGWKSGMDDVQAYSIINAGTPNGANRSDANNGGAPGTVRDKVMNQMDGHRAKALRLLQGKITAPTGTRTAAPKPRTAAPEAEIATPSPHIAAEQGLGPLKRNAEPTTWNWHAEQLKKRTAQ